MVGGRPEGGPLRVAGHRGDTLRFAVVSDEADELHVHGYDLGADLAPGTPATVEFDATIPGVFEVELHDAGTLLLSLQVS